MRRLHLLSGGRPKGDGPDDDKPGPDDPVTRGLKELYSSPAEGYWDSLEAKVMAAVRAGRGAPQAVAEWWHALADWAGRGLVAAGILLVIAGMAAMQSRVASTAADRAARGGTAREIEPLDADLARALDLMEETEHESAAEAKDAREAADLLIDGVYRRPPVARPTAPAPRASADERDEVLRARREATFRYVMP
jgi:hypothetical protein